MMISTKRHLATFKYESQLHTNYLKVKHNLNIEYLKYET